MPLDLVDVPAIAEMLGVGKRRARQLADTPGFPAPAAELAIGRVWRRRQVERWTSTRRGPGRPRSSSRADLPTGNDKPRRDQR